MLRIPIGNPERVLIAAGFNLSGGAKNHVSVHTSVYSSFVLLKVLLIASYYKC